MRIVKNDLSVSNRLKQQVSGKYATVGKRQRMEEQDEMKADDLLCGPLRSQKWRTTLIYFSEELGCQFQVNVSKFAAHCLQSFYCMIIQSKHLICPFLSLTCDLLHYAFHQFPNHNNNISKKYADFYVIMALSSSLHLTLKKLKPPDSFISTDLQSIQQ